MNLQLMTQLIPLNTAWCSVEGGFNIHSIRDNEYLGHISDIELAQIHPHVPAAIRLMPPSDEFALKLRTMIGIWDSSMQLEANDGKKVAIFGIRSIAIKAKTVDVECYGTYYSDVILPDGQDTVRLPDEHVQNFKMSRKWLDTAHPGWKNRYLVACDLDMSLTHAVRAMVQNVPVVKHTVVLPEGLTS